MRYGAFVTPSGQVRIERGPVSMTLAAWEGASPNPKACLRAASRVDGLLRDIVSQPSLRKPWPETDPRTLYGVGLVMWRAARDAGHGTMTPMSAVAGAIADDLTETAAALLDAGRPAKVLANNGGDIALYLRRGASAVVGLLPALEAGAVDEILTVSERHAARGVATSGLGGRGLTQGIADAVTAFAATSAQADALATRLCNASFVDAPQVRRILAGRLRPGCDIESLPVTLEVGRLSPETIEQSFEHVREVALPLMARGILHGLRVVIQGRRRWLGAQGWRASPPRLPVRA